MKHIFSILLMILILSSCAKEREIIVPVEEFPETIELVESTINGTIADALDQPINQAEATIHYQEYILGKVSSLSDGSFELLEKPIDMNNSYISFTKEGYSPNYYSAIFENFSSISLTPKLKPWIVDKAFDNQSEILNLTDIAKVSIEDNLLGENIDSKLQIQFLDFSSEESDLLLINRSKEQELNFSHALYFKINTGSDSLPWNSNSGVTLSLNNDTSLNLEDDYWRFDTNLGYWIKEGQLSFDGSDYSASLSTSGFYAFSSSCSNDVTPPTPYCITENFANFPDLSDAVLYAVDFNLNSFDNCDDDLDFAIRRVDDICGNGSDEFGESITLCPEDDGLTIEIVLRVTDDALNVDSCITTIQITGDTITNTGCMDDIVPPTPYCLSNSVYLFTEGSSNLAYAVDFNFQSFDNCTADEDLVFMIRKTSDICQNGSDQLSETISLCSDEVGTTIELEVHAIDEANNSDFCTISLQVE